MLMTVEVSHVYDSGHGCFFRIALLSRLSVMNDKAVPHSIAEVSDTLECDYIEHVECPAYSLDLNSMHHAWASQMSFSKKLSQLEP